MPNDGPIGDTGALGHCGCCNQCHFGTCFEELAGVYGSVGTCGQCFLDHNGFLSCTTAKRRIDAKRVGLTPEAVSRIK